MGNFISSLAGSGHGSLLVAFIALFGVLVTTWWNNKRADRRRLADQAAEDARRKAEEERLERERQRQWQREDWARQRYAVADCIKAIHKAEQDWYSQMAALQRQPEGDDTNIVLLKRTWSWASSSGR